MLPPLPQSFESIASRTLLLIDSLSSTGIWWYQCRHTPIHHTSWSKLQHHPLLPLHALFAPTYLESPSALGIPWRLQARDCRTLHPWLSLSMHRRDTKRTSSIPTSGKMKLSYTRETAAALHTWSQHRSHPSIHEKLWTIPVSLPICLGSRLQTHHKKARCQGNHTLGSCPAVCTAPQATLAVDRGSRRYALIWSEPAVSVFWSQL